MRNVQLRLVPARLAASLVPARPAPPPPASPGEVLAEAEALRVFLGGRPVLDGVDVRVRAGEVLALVGPNGAGKSTLLGALAADVPAAEGVVRVHGRPVSAWSAPELALRRAVLPQSASLSFPFPVEEVVRMGRAPWAGGDEAAEDDAVVADAMSRTEVTGFAGRPFSALSGGERARVALARVLAQRAPLLLLDEPTAALDLRHQELVLRLCRERARAGDAVVVVLHDLALAAAYADRVAVLRAGRVAADGPPAEVFAEELLSEVYDQPVEVLPHPRTGALLVLPRREP
ncbi:heme ABC transporter ATP-binding protein [Streptomyces olivaceus]|uniref:Heme ABC transporter ATP-binding protein n=1 Tax=Streptomyces olivaceus TaxID=47716 RepID=A0ABS7W9L8_STROV|nr:heme ABC transporter ATP-binding protein [Streptomyces olivaceus]MBZ6089172.1 heme ABC transporter ATP-binding protein [Streptomyces olivaceus]MBZ6097310.1 heme ABC transporter ATP-binding protein [Streptomyces olivaceus]MBZ6120718.1 heme ABC transporter ATP-binding protein [Streptomyces olivaceus]MBZ6154640.1 heme ABC transporter ATP-binding protein [Streptomyces olivaceus]MBZ6284622.1 heme ABC transporter ATP-binding protein [Streptomyces olivaceus]